MRINEQLQKTSGVDVLLSKSGAPWVRQFGKLSIRENLVMTSPYVRTDPPGRVSRNEFLRSSLESLSPIVSKAFRNDWQIRICQLTKCLLDFRGRPFDFWGGYGWFQRKCPADWFREEKSMQINSWEKNILHWKNYRSWRIMLKKNCTGKKILTSERFGKKFFQYKLNQ